MIDIASLPPAAQAAGLIGVVLLEAMVLYVVYGVVEQAIGNRLIERIKNS